MDACDRANFVSFGYLLTIATADKLHNVTLELYTCRTSQCLAKALKITRFIWISKLLHYEGVKGTWRTNGSWLVSINYCAIITETLLQQNRAFITWKMGRE